MTALLAEAIHLVSSDSAAGHVKQATRQRLLWTFGSHFVPIWRLRSWAAHGAIARELRAPSNDNRLEQEVFRLTRRTRALLADGLESLGDALPIHVGGCRLNDPAAPWVRITDESGWRIIQHPRT